MELSDLDRIIKEHEIEKSKMYWRKRDKLFRHSMGFMTISTLCVFPLGLLGDFFVIGGCILFICGVLPALFISFAEILVFCFNSK